MIRMGRSSRPDEPDSQEESQTTPSTGYSYEKDYGATKAMSESETMARDIKDGRLNGFVGHGTVLTGETYFHSMLRVDGQLTGKVVSEDGTLLVGSTGQVDADVSVSGAMINGTVNGDIIATSKLELGRTAKVVGNIQTPRLIIEDGAVLEGSCSMIQQMEERDQAAAAAVTGQAEPEEEESQYEIRAESEEVEEITGYSSSSYSYGSTDDDDDDDEMADDEDEEEEESAEAAIT